MGSLAKAVARLVCWMLLVHGAAAVGQELSAALDRTTLFEGESVRLTVELNGEAGDLAPDFSILERDFEIGDSTTSSQFRFENGRRSMQTRWSVVLEPRASGEFRIPSLAVGDRATEPLSLTVLPRDESADGQELFLEMAVMPGDPYVHAQVLLTLKLYHVQALTEGRLVEPELPDAVVERLGEDLTYSANIDGTRYRVLERRFAVFPERSGPMDIAPARFVGRVTSSGRGGSSIFDRGRRVSVASEALRLEVQPRPQAFPGDEWIPAATLEITESWPEAGVEFRVGEPVTRRLKIRAKGLLSVQLPELAVPAVEEMKVYPDQVQSQSRTDGTWVFGEREQGYALVPTREGPVTLPEIRVSWWNTELDRLEQAVIPAREIVVLPSTLPAPPPPSPPQAAEPQSRGAQPVPLVWPLAAVAGFGLWLLTLLAWWLERRKRSTGACEREAPVRPGAAPSRRRLEAACRDDDATLAASALLAWARSEDPAAPASLGALSRRIADADLAAAIGELDRVLYGAGDAGRWTGARLLEALRHGLELTREAAPPGRRVALPPLYPETGSG